MENQGQIIYGRQRNTDGVLPESLAKRQEHEPPSDSFSPSWRFWLVFVALFLISFSSSIDMSIIINALPTIVSDIGGESVYIWIANSFMIAGTVLQPFYAQSSNIFGRRLPMLTALAIFIIGSGISGGAKNAATLIAGRSIQGLGAGGMYVLLDVILCDMVPLRSRTKYLGMMYCGAAIGTVVGPPLGGLLAEHNWRWIFYLNIPIAGAAMITVLLFMPLRYTRSPTWKHALLRIDYIGELVFIPSVLAVLLGLIRGGVEYSWNSWRIIIPLVLGFLGWAAFHVIQKYVPEPTMSPRLFGNRTSVVGYIFGFSQELLIYFLAYFLPIYFQAVLGSSPLRSGIQFLPTTAALLPASIVSGILIEKTGRYKAIQLASFSLQAIGFGLFSILDENSTTGAWAGFQIITAVGSGLTLATCLTVVLASLPEEDVATATGAYSFTRQFGAVWGVTLSAVVFNGEFDKYAYRIMDDTVRSRLTGGHAYALAGNGYLSTLSESTLAQVRQVYVLSLSRVWYVAIAFSVFAFFLVFVEKNIKLRDSLDTEFGLVDQTLDLKRSGDLELNSAQNSSP
ncbi:major facilitator superfamily domain-containing protein [Xylariales sp. PMI_506]|nr:major facilitator superfamily domain-containing protein [Xylariales sp. PMI_506]